MCLAQTTTRAKSNGVLISSTTTRDERTGDLPINMLGRSDDENDRQLQLIRKATKKIAWTLHLLQNSKVQKCFPQNVVDPVLAFEPIFGTKRFN